MSSSGASRMVSRHACSPPAAGLGGGEGDRHEHLGADVVELVLERRGHAEAAAAAAQRPQEIWVPFCVRAYELAVGGHHVSADQVVARKSVVPREKAHAAFSVSPAMPVRETTPNGVAR